MAGLAVYTAYCSFSCTDTHEKPEPTTYWSLGDSVEYVGMTTCGGCHVEIYESFRHTGMGQSFGLAKSSKSAGDFSKPAIIHDKYSGFSYCILWNKDDMVLHEFRVNELGDTVHLLERTVDYIIGSGQHTNSHLFQENGYLYQMPITFYSQKGVWDLPPGFEKGANSRFSRPIGLECMSCHNAMPLDFVAGSTNKFTSIPLGIDCERCHGPGSAHVAKIMRGDFTDTAVEIDYSIVNPKKLEPELTFQICQRCHLQGNAVLADGKSFFDFRPGTMLHEVMDVYIPRYQNDPSFIMASHADRLKQSVCFIQSKGAMDCTKCHNPHVSVKHSGHDQFEDACLSCHGSKEACSLPHLERGEKSCIQCHMPSNSTSDIPHVQVHDHRIAKSPVLNPQEKKTLVKFVGLQAINNPTPTRASRIRAYLQQYERFESDPRYLDSLRLLFAMVPDPKELSTDRVNFFYLSDDVEGFRAWVDLIGQDYLLDTWTLRTYDNSHAWAAFKTAEMISSSEQPESAERFYIRAIELAPHIVDYHFKYGNFLAKQQRYHQALSQYKDVVQSRRLSEETWSNLGFVLAEMGRVDSAKVCFEEALRCNPTYGPAKVNLLRLQEETN